MLGHHWEPAQATTVQVRHNVSGHGAHREHHYLVRLDAPPGNRAAGHHWVTERSEFPRQIGETVAIEVNAKANEVRMDSGRSQPPSGVVDMAQQIREGQAAFSAGPGGFPGGPGGMPGAAGGAGAAGGSPRWRRLSRPGRLGRRTSRCWPAVIRSRSPTSSGSRWSAWRRP